MAKSIVKQIGAVALSFKEEGILILYGPNAPQELREIAIIHEKEDEVDIPLEMDGKFKIDGQEYQLTKVGSHAKKNLEELGHISIYFTDVPDDILPGAIYVTPHALPTVTEGSAIEFLPAE